MLDIASEAETYNLLTLLAVGEKDLCCYCIQLLLWWGRVQKNLVSGENILDIGQILWQLDSPTLRMKTGGADSSRLILSWSAGRMQTDPQVGIKRAVDQDSNSDCQPLNVRLLGGKVLIRPDTDGTRQHLLFIPTIPIAFPLTSLIPGEHKLRLFSFFSCPQQLNRTHCLSLGWAPLTIRVFTALQSDPRDLWPQRHLIRVMRRHDLTKESTYLPTHPPTYQP